MLKQIEGSRAVAEAVASLDAERAEVAEPGKE